MDSLDRLSVDYRKFGLGMREWLWKHRKAVFPLAIVLMASVSLLAHKASGNSWSFGIFATLFNLVWWGGLYYLYARQTRKRKTALEKRGLFVYLRYPGSRPGSLQDMWAGGTAACYPHQILFQEVMSGSDVPLGRPTTLDVVSLAGSPLPVSGGKTGHLPPGLNVLALALTHGTVEIAAEPSALERLEQQVLHGGPQA